MRKTVSYILAAVMFSGLFSFCLPVAAAESIYINKVVSVVYDDSGSMSTGSSADWAYANYAMQSFCGLLNGDDRLFITYMSEAEDNPDMIPAGIDLSAGGIQGSVDAIRNHETSGNTPYGAVDIAFNKLKSVSDTDASTQYWLFIITDGEFQDEETDVIEKDEIDRRLAAYTAETMPNGSRAQITYLAIGDEAVAPDENRDAGIFVYTSSGSSDIINVMSTISGKVSGRSPLDSAEITVTDGNTVRITTAIPLLSISVLAQKTGARLTGITGGGDSPAIERSASVSYPTHEGWTTNTALNGSVYLLSNSGGSIPAGTYTLHFDSAVAGENISVMFEPAFDYRISVLLGGKPVSDFSALNNAYAGDTVSISCKVYEAGTDNEIKASLLPGNTLCSLSVTEDGKEVKTDTSTDMNISEYTLSNRPTSIRAQITIPGFTPVVLSSGTFTPQRQTVYTVEVTGLENPVMSVSQLEKNTSCLRFIIKVDGVAVTKAQAQAMDFTITTDSEGVTVYEDDGSITFTPTLSAGSSPILGRNNVVGTLNGTITATGSYTVNSTAYTIDIIKPDNLSLTVSQLRENTEKITFIAREDGRALTRDEVQKLSFNIDTTAPGEITYGEDGSVSFTPRYADPVTDIPTGNITVTASLGNLATAKTNFHVEPLEFTLVASPPENSTVYRTSLGRNTAPVRYTVSADGRQLDRATVESMDIYYSLNAPYSGLIRLDVSVDDDGIISVTPVYPSWGWFAAYTVPLGELTVTASWQGHTDSATFSVERNFISELIWNWVLLILAALILLGYLFKKRFKYSALIHFNTAVASDGILNGDIEGWKAVKLKTWTAYLPFVTDSVTVNGVRFTASRIIVSSDIYVSPARLGGCCGVLGGGLSEYKSIRFHTSDIVMPENGKKQKLVNGNALIVSGDVNFRCSDVYLYSEF